MSRAVIACFSGVVVGLIFYTFCARVGIVFPLSIVFACSVGLGWVVAFNFFRVK